MTVTTATAFSAPASVFDTNNGGLHEANIPAVVPDPGAMSLRTVFRRGDCDAWIEAISNEQPDLPEVFDDNTPAFAPTPRDDTPTDAQVFDSLITSVVHRNGKPKSRWVVDSSRRFNKGRTRDPSTSSPTCLAMSVALALAPVAQFDRSILQLDVAKAYMLAAPLSARTSSDTHPGSPSSFASNYTARHSPPATSLYASSRRMRRSRRRTRLV